MSHGDKKRSPINKCELCGLRAVFPQIDPKEGREIEDFFVKMRQLQKQKLIPPGYGRHMKGGSGTDASEICIMDGRAWRINDAPCHLWQPDILDLEAADHIHIANAKQAEQLTRVNIRLTYVIIALTVVAVLPILHKIFKFFN